MCWAGARTECGALWHGGKFSLGLMEEGYELGYAGWMGVGFGG